MPGDDNEEVESAEFSSMSDSFDGDDCLMTVHGLAEPPLMPTYQAQPCPILGELDGAAEQQPKTPPLPLFDEVACFSAGTFKFQRNPHHADRLVFESNMARVYDEGNLRLDSRVRNPSQHD